MPTDHLPVPPSWHGAALGWLATLGLFTLQILERIP